MNKAFFATEKFWNMVGAGLGALIILLGIIFLCSPADSFHTESADYASFGADYYTYQYEATTIVATNTAVTANNLRELSEKLASYTGTAFLMAGLLITAHYSKKLVMELCADAPAQEAPVEMFVSEEAVAAEEPTEE